MILGITGGVGAGKSSVLSILENEYDAFVIKADDVARDLMKPSMPCYESVVRAYGSGILLPDGTIDRKALAARTFASEQETRRLNAMIHPQVKEAIHKLIADEKAAPGKRLTVIEAALLEEGGLSEICDRVWYVYADEETRISRIMASRGYDRKRCEDTIARQKSDVQFRSECDAVIDNRGSLELTRARIRHLLEFKRR